MNQFQNGTKKLELNQKLDWIKKLTKNWESNKNKQKNLDMNDNSSIRKL